MAKKSKKPAAGDSLAEMSQPTKNGKAATPSPSPAPALSSSALVICRNK